MSGPIHLADSLKLLPAHSKRLLLAYSGGIDSTVLLHTLLEHRQQFSLVLWHINHGLQDNAQAMEDFARQQAARYHIEFRLDRLHMDAGSSNLEAHARELRYHRFERAMSDGDVLLTAHHKTDQAETLMLNLLRGSGSAGLRAIARIRSLDKGLLFRPLLDFTRDDVERYAALHGLEWVEDPSNCSLKHDRNYLRHQLFPTLVKRWPAAIEQFQRVSELQNESEQLHIDLARIDYSATKLVRPFSPVSCLSLEGLSALSVARQKNLIRFWIRHHDYAAFGFQRMEELLRQLHSRVDAMPVIEGSGYSIRIYKKALYLVATSSDLDLSPIYRFPSSGPLSIPEIGFSQTRSQIFSFLKRVDSGQSLSLHFRQQAHETSLHLHAHSLKRQFQKQQIPPWIRSLVPQIFVDDRLLALWLL